MDQTVGFNRYMVECESAKVELNFRLFRVLIDTWWNVNYDRLACRKEAFEVLIDTWWNVNFCNP